MSRLPKQSAIISADSPIYFRTGCILRSSIILFCFLFIVYCLFFAFCLLSSVFCFLFIACFLSSVFCLLCIACLLSSVFCLLSFVYCLSSVFCLLFFVYCLFFVFCLLFFVLPHHSHHFLPIIILRRPHPKLMPTLGTFMMYPKITFLISCSNRLH